MLFCPGNVTIICKYDMQLHLWTYKLHFHRLSYQQHIKSALVPAVEHLRELEQEGKYSFFVAMKVFAHCALY